MRRRRLLTTSATRGPFVAATPSTRPRLYDCVCSMAWAFGASERRLPVDWGLSCSLPTLGRLRVVDGMEIARTSSLSGCEHRVPLRALGVIGGGQNFGGCDLGGNAPGEGASVATTASDMDVEEGAAGPRDAAGGADVGAVGGQDGTDPVSMGGEAVVNAGSEAGAVDAAVTGVAASIKGPGQPPATRQRTTSASGEEQRVTSAFVNPLRSCGVDALPRQYASHSSPRRHRRDCVSTTASARWRGRLELLKVVDWGLSRLPPALRINGDVSRSHLAVTFRVRV